MKINITIQDILHNIHEQSLQDQRFPYPLKRIIESVGIDINKLESIDPSAIQCSKRFFLFAIKYDGMEMERLGMSWVKGGWLIDKGPAVNESLKGLEFEVNTSLLEKHA